MDPKDLMIVSFQSFTTNGCPFCRAHSEVRGEAGSVQIVFCSECQGSFALLPKNGVGKIVLCQRVIEKIPTISYLRKG